MALYVSLDRSGGAERSRRRSQSVSPSQSPSSSRPIKRRSTHQLFSAFQSTSANADQPKMPNRRRKSSFFNLFSFNKFVPRAEGYVEMLEIESNSHDPQREAIERPPSEQGSTVIVDEHACFSASASMEPSQSRRSSRLSSIGSKLLSFLPVIRLRKDSGTCDNSAPESPRKAKNPDLACSQLPTTNKDAHLMGDILHNTASIEPLAHRGRLRFMNRSSYTLAEDEGPSDYWRAELYQNRQCIDTHNDPLCNHPPRESLDWEPENLRTPSPETNANAGVGNDPHRRNTLQGWSSAPSQNRRRSSAIRSLFRKAVKDERGRKTPPNSRQPSRTPPILGNCTDVVNHPNTFGADLNFNLQVSINELGVIPASDAESIEDSTDIPHATYAHTPSIRSSIRPLLAPPPAVDNNSNGSMRSDRGVDLPQSRSPSIIAIYTASPYPPSPFIRPVTKPSSRSGSDRLPSPPPLSLNHAGFLTPACCINIQPHSDSRCTTMTESTAVDDSWDYEDLGLRRASSLVGILDILEGLEVGSIEYRRDTFDEDWRHDDSI